MKKAFILMEYLMGMAVLALMMGLLLFSYRVVLDRVTLGNEAYAVKRYMEYARDYANTRQQTVTFQIKNKGIELVDATGKVLNRHVYSKIVIITGPTFYFTPNLTPSMGVTETISVGRLSKKVIVDPSTGRIRISG